MVYKSNSGLAVPETAVMVAVKLNQKRIVQVKVKIRRSVVRSARAIPQIAAVEQKGHMGHTKLRGSVNEHRDSSMDGVKNRVPADEDEMSTDV
jgi:hypothetical protein